MGGGDIAHVCIWKRFIFAQRKRENMKLHKSWDEIEWGRNIHPRLKGLPPYFYEVMGIIVVAAVVVSGIVWLLIGERQG